MTIALIVIRYFALIISLVVHEYMHGLIAYWQGDETARRAGRLTLNPLVHVDMVGTVILPLAAIATGMPVFGWAKPVPFNPYNLRNQKWGATMVGLAGPISNFAMAAIFLEGLRVALINLNLSSENLLVIFLLNLAIVNIVLGIFNLIPVPPLDGSKLLAALLDSPKYRNFLITLETKGPTILMIVILFDAFSPHSFLGGIFSAVISGAFGLFGLGGF